MTSVYGLLPAPVNDYTTTVIPVLISVPVLWRVECFFSRIIPKAVAFSFVPFTTMLVMVPVSLCITAPAGSYLGMLLGRLCGLHGLIDERRHRVAAHAHGACRGLGVP